MKIRTFSKFLAVVAVFAMMLSFASCFGGGQLKLESFTVDKSTVKTNYLIGDEIDFSGIKATAKYSDASLNKTYSYGELTITYDKDITATPGNKIVTVSFDDPHLKVKQSTQVEIKVSGAGAPVDDPQPLVSFAAPSSLGAFDKANKADGKPEYGATGFSGQFAVGGKAYIVGNENEFIFIPEISVFSDGESKVLENFYGVVSLYIYKENAYVALTAVAGEGTVVNYYDGETLIATVDTYEGTYQFEDDALAKKVKISVLPSADYYEFDDDVKAVEIEVEIIKAYNVYEAWQLAVIDNRNDAYNEFKLAHGIANVTASGIVLHNDIELTADDVPASFFYTTTDEVVYTNATNSDDKKIIPAGSKYLIDGTFLYDRIGADDFVIEGNFFAIDASSFPLVPSPGVFTGSEDSDKNYGGDFSNACIFMFKTTENHNGVAKPADVANVSFKNLKLIGNAARDNYVDSKGGLASAGGLIFVKSSNFTEVTVDNVIGNSFFITYFAEDAAKITTNYVKCFDSYQNAAFIWSDSEFIVNNSWFDGCGGPVIIAMSITKNAPDLYHPNIKVTNSVVNTALTGNEIWFAAVGGDGLIAAMKLLNGGLANSPTDPDPQKRGLGVGSFINDKGEMNIQAILLPDFNDASFLSDLRAQGSLDINGNGIYRYDDDNADTMSDWEKMKEITMTAATSGGGTPAFITVNFGGQAYTIYTDGAGFYDLDNNAFYPHQPADDAPEAEKLLAAKHNLIYYAFTQANAITLTQGSLSVVFEFVPHAAA